MNRFLTLLKMNIKLLLRNKGFLFFLIITPVVSVIVLGLKTESAAGYKEENIRTKIHELKDSNEKAIYAGGSMASVYIIKVYDASKTELSEYMLNELVSSGMFCVCRMDASGMTEKEVLAQAEADAYNDRAGVLLYLKKDFNKAITEGDIKNAFVTYEVSKDGRTEFFKDAFSSSLNQVYSLFKTGMGEEETLRILETIKNELPVKETKVINAGEKAVLNKEQGAAKERIGYAFAIITLGFLFCGVCVAYTIIEEQENRVYTRMMLSGLGSLEYIAAKFVMAITISALQTGVLGICLFVTGNPGFGINIFSFLLVIFLLGLVFSVISLCTGIIAGNVMSANYTVFAIWSVSAMLAGLYFPLDSTSEVLKAASFLMPQKWFMEAAEILLAGGNGAYSMLLCVTAAYLIIVISFSSIGLKIRHQDN